MRLSMGLILNILIRLAIVYFLGEVVLFPDDPRFAGKAIPIRNLVIVVTLSFLFPFLYFVKRKWTPIKSGWKAYPLWLDNLYLSIFWLDMTGNSLDLYDSYFYFDLFPHLHGTGAIAAVFYGAFGMSGLAAVALANGIHMLLEGQEIFTDIFFGTHNVRGAFDTINDILVGLIGTVFYVGIFRLWKKHWHKRILQFAIIFFTTVILLAMIFHHVIATHVKAVLLLSQQFNLPIKLLHTTTNEPSQKRIELDSENGKIVLDLIAPAQNRDTVNKHKKPVIIVAMGVKTAEKDKPIILDFAKNMSRIGYVVLWPRLETLDQGISGFEQPETFITAFRYAEEMEQVDKERISFVGFSVGSSIAFVAASDPAINENVHGFVFFGGYYDIFAYLKSVAVNKMIVNGEEVSWEPSEGVTSHLREIAQETESETLELLSGQHTPEEVEEIFKATPNREIETLRNLSPKEHPATFKAHTFILHETSDTYVPYSESVKLKEALPKEQIGAFHIANLFEHVQPKKGFSREVAGEFFKLYGFLYECLRYL